MPQTATSITTSSTPTMNDFVATYFEDLSRVWKASTAKRNADAWRGDLAPHFGDILVADVTKADVVRWRDAFAGEREARYNRAIPVLAALLNYAEALKMRRKGSNPCRGMPRYKRQAMERYLTPREYARVGAELRARAPARRVLGRLGLRHGAVVEAATQGAAAGVDGVAIAHGLKCRGSQRTLLTRAPSRARPCRPRA